MQSDGGGMVYRQTEKTRLRNEQRRRDILSAARSLFAEKGYGRTTMNHIVKRADTSIGNAYFYFKNKEELLREIVMDIIADFWEIQDDIIESSNTAVMKLALVLYHSMWKMISNDEVAQLLIIGNAMPGIRQSMFDDFSARVGELVNTAPGEFKEINTDLAIDSTYGSQIWILERKRSGEIPYEIEEICRFNVQWTLQAICVSKDVIERTLQDLVKHTSVRNLSS